MDRLVSMQAFTRVVDVGSFGGAAGSRDLPKATLTRLIQKPETHLAAKLLHRTTRRISVSSDSAAYYERYVRIPADIEEAEHLLTRHNNSPRGTLTVDTTSGTARMVLMPQLHDFCNAYPEIRLELTSNGKPIDLLKEGVDVVLRVGAMEEAMVWRRIGWFSVAFYASPIDLRRFGTPQDLAELAQHKGCEPSVEPHQTRDTVVAHARRRTQRNAAAFGDFHERCRRPSGLRLDGPGIARVSRASAEPCVNSGRLVEIMSGWQPDQLPISVMYPQNRHLSSKVRVFVNWAAKISSRHPHYGAEAPKLAA